MKHALIITTISGFVPQFEMNDVRILQENGYTVHYASDFENPIYNIDQTQLKRDGLILHHIDIRKSIFTVKTDHQKRTDQSGTLPQSNGWRGGKACRKSFRKRTICSLHSAWVSFLRGGSEEKLAALLYGREISGSIYRPDHYNQQRRLREG